MERKLFAPQRAGACAMLMADADNLKQVNDRYGHQNGDRYLQGVARIFRSVCGEKSVLARLSGDEFAAFLYGCSNREELESLVERLRSRDECGDGGADRRRVHSGAFFRRLRVLSRGRRITEPAQVRGHGDVQGEADGKIKSWKNKDFGPDELDQGRG